MRLYGRAIGISVCHKHMEGMTIFQGDSILEPTLACLATMRGRTFDQSVLY